MIPVDLRKKIEMKQDFLLIFTNILRERRERSFGVIKVALVTAGKTSYSAFTVLREMENKVAIAGIADLSGDFSWLKQAEKRSYFATQDLVKLLSLPDIDVVLDTTDSQETNRLIHELVKPGVSVMEARPGNLLMALLQSKEELLEAKRLKSELGAILDSVQDAIEAVDTNGVIKYVNHAFTRVTGIPEQDRVGKNIFEVSPQGALAQSLIRQRPVTGYRTVVGGSDAEVISNAAPIKVEGEMEGAVVVFQPITDILKLVDELQKSNIIIENLYERIDQITGSKYTFTELIGENKIFKAAVDMAKQAAKSDSPVLITGESGTGKKMFAHAIHHASSRYNRPFLKLDCAAIPETMLDMEFFGYEKGAFSGAVRTKLGRAELADGGTLFLDNLGEVNLNFQEKLFKLLSDKTFRRIGGTEPIQSNVRVIASTSQDLKELVRRGRFREDLFYQIQTIDLRIPPLRRRTEDIPLLGDHFISIFNRKYGKKVSGPSSEALQLGTNYEWPGNIKELEFIIERAMIVAEGTKLEKDHLAPYIARFSGMGMQQFSEVVPLDKMEQMMLKTALSRYGETLEGKKKAAQALNISLATLYNKIKKYKANL